MLAPGRPRVSARPDRRRSAPGGGGCRAGRPPSPPGPRRDASATGWMAARGWSPILGLRSADTPGPAASLIPSPRHTPFDGISIVDDRSASPPRSPRAYFKEPVAVPACGGLGAGPGNPRGTPLGFAVSRYLHIYISVIMCNGDWRRRWAPYNEAGRADNASSLVVMGSSGTGDCSGALLRRPCLAAAVNRPGTNLAWAAAPRVRVNPGAQSHTGARCVSGKAR